MPPSAILIAGPTASGKSAFAINLALEHNGVIINADSMQVYDHLRIVTARPSMEEAAQCEHLLYGHRDPGKPYSVAGWLDEANDAIDNVRARGKVPIFVGGTGLYFKGLVEGLSPVPELDPDIRMKWREFAVQHGDELHQELSVLDPVAARQLRESDHQRLIRALEVIDSTGKSIIEWQNADKGTPLLGGEKIRKIVLMPERVVLHDRINRRFDTMVAAGAPGEVEAFLALGIGTTLPAMKAIGVPQFAGYLAGDYSLDGATEKAKAASRQYAKRQSTWFNNQFGDDWEYVR